MSVRWWATSLAGCANSCNRQRLKLPDRIHPGIQSHCRAIPRGYVIKYIVINLSIAIGAAFASACAYASNGVPALEIISPSGGRSILMGTLHVADPSLRQPDPSVLDDFRQLVLEHAGVVEIAGAASSAVTSPAWSALLSSGQVTQLRSHLQCRHPFFDASQINQFLQIYLQQPTPTAANQLAYETCDSVGYRSRDEIITKAADDRHLPRNYLETDEEIRALRLQLPTDNVRQSFEAAFSPAAAQLKARVVDALNRGDSADVAAAVEESQKLSGDDPKRINTIMVQYRNDQWMKKLPGLLATGGSFVLVGVAHLPGPDGLIARLRALGFAVEPIELPAGNGR